MGFIFRILRRVLMMLVAPALLIGAGWYGGAKYGASPLLINAVDGALSKGRALLTPILGKAVEKSGEVAASAAQQGSEYVVGTVEQMLRDLADAPQESEETGEDLTPETPSEAGGTPTVAAPSPQVAASDGIILCNMRISNQPRRGNPGTSIGGTGETTTYKGAELLLMPATKACLSSGYGYRNGKLHKGVDYYSDQGGDALAAGDGRIVEAVSRSDYGNMVVIDHGGGVYTRYAHLARFGGGVREGASVRMGETLGPIGQSGASSIVHLHYEVLTGDYNTNAKSFGLNAVDPFGL